MQKFDARQTISRDALSRLSLAAGAELDNLLRSINAEVTPSFEIVPNAPATLAVTINDSTVSNPETLKNKGVPAIALGMPRLTGGSGTVTLPASSGGSITVSPGTGATLTISSGNYATVLIYIDATNQLNVLVGAQSATANGAIDGLLTVPDGCLGIGFILAHNTGGTIDAVTNAMIYQFGSGGGASSSGGAGILDPVPGYSILAAESFTSVQGSSNDTTDTTLTKATLDVSKKLYRMSLDKSKTVSTSSGTALTISGAPTYTVQVGDIVYMTSGARINQWRRITAVGSQTSFTLDAAFTGGDAANGDTLMVSQAVWTKDLVNFGSASELNRPRDLYPSKTVPQILVDYSDSVVASDDVGDFTQTARVVMSASNEGLQAATGTPLSSNFTQGVYTRPNAPSALTNYVLQSNTNTERLFLVFFPNPTNGSVTSIANLLDFECNFYAEDDSVNGGVLDSAYGTANNSTTPYNCTISTPSGQTIVDTSFSFYTGADPSGVGSQLRVYVNGQFVPKFKDSGTTPTASQLSYTLGNDANGLPRRIIFSSDLSGFNYDIQIYRQFGVYDASFTKTAKLDSFYDAIVGSSAQVTDGIATHSTLTSALAAVVDGSNILILNNVTITDTPSINKRVMIEGKGPGSVITGATTFTSAAAGSIVKNLKFNGNLTLNASADRIFIKECYMSASGTFSNDGSNTQNVIEIITE